MSDHPQIKVADARIEGESALYVKLVPALEPGSIAATATFDKAIVTIDVDADDNILGIGITW